MFCNILICDFIRGRLLNAKKPEKVSILTFTFCNLNKIEFLTLFYISAFDCLSKESIALGLEGYSSSPP